GHGVGADVVVLPVDADLAGGDHLALGVDAAGDVQGREAHRLEAPRVDVDLHLAEDPAEDGGAGQPFDAGQLLAEGGVGVVEEELVVAGLAGDDQVSHGDGAGVVAQDGGGQHAGGQVLHLAVDQGDDLAGGDVAVDL